MSNIKMTNGQQTVEVQPGTVRVYEGMGYSVVSEKKAEKPTSSNSKTQVQKEVSKK